MACKSNGDIVAKKDGDIKQVKQCLIIQCEDRLNRAMTL